MTKLRIVFLSILSVGAWVEIAQANSRPNVIVFLVDDMGWTDSSPYGSKYYDTPQMDRLAKQGMRFTQAYSQPLCSPTRASILTGQYSARHGITSASGHQPPQPPGHSFYPDKAPPNQPLMMPESKNYLEPSQVTLAEALREAGYRTAHLGKWHLGLTQPYWPEAQGFDVAFHCHPDPGPPNFYFSPYGVLPPGAPRADEKATSKFVTGTITDGPPGEYITDRLTDEALKFIAANKSRPFYLNLWHYGVHGPWGHKESITAEMARRSDPTGRHDNPVMASMLKSIDESLGRILDQLDELQLAENTVILFTSDNGGNTHSMTEADDKAGRTNAANPNIAGYRKWAGFKPPTNNSPLRDGKGRLYEGGIRVPLMVRWPGKIAPGSTSEAIVGCIDVYPTVLDLVGLAPPPQQKIDGVSYAAVLRGSGSLQREAYFTWFPHLVPGVAVRKGDWKLIRRFTERPDDYDGLHELFNLRDDLGETTDLAAKMPDKVKELDALIDAFVRETGALYPRPNPAYEPRPTVSTSSPKQPVDPSAGLVPKFCKTTFIPGALRVEAAGRTPFLGTTQVKHTGPLTLRLRTRSAKGGAGQVQWKTADQDEFPKSGQRVEFRLNADTDWQEIAVAVPVAGQIGIVRLYLPAAEGPIDIESIQYVAPSSGRVIRQWSFQSVK